MVKHRKSGFTLIETLISAVLILVLLSVSILANRLLYSQAQINWDRTQMTALADESLSAAQLLRDNWVTGQANGQPAKILAVAFGFGSSAVPGDQLDGMFLGDPCGGSNCGNTTNGTAVLRWCAFPSSSSISCTNPTHYSPVGIRGTCDSALMGCSVSSLNTLIGDKGELLAIRRTAYTATNTWPATCIYQLGNNPQIVGTSQTANSINDGNGIKPCILVDQTSDWSFYTRKTTITAQKIGGSAVNTFLVTTTIAPYNNPGAQFSKTITLTDSNSHYAWQWVNQNITGIYGSTNLPPNSLNATGQNPGKYSFENEVLSFGVNSGSLYIGSSNVSVCGNNCWPQLWKYTYDPSISHTPNWKGPEYLQHENTDINNVISSTSLVRITSMSSNAGILYMGTQAAINSGEVLSILDNNNVWSEELKPDGAYHEFDSLLSYNGMILAGAYGSDRGHPERIFQKNPPISNWTILQDNSSDKKHPDFIISYKDSLYTSVEDDNQSKSVQILKQSAGTPWTVIYDHGNEPAGINESVSAPVAVVFQNKLYVGTDPVGLEDRRPNADNKGGVGQLMSYDGSNWNKVGLTGLDDPNDSGIDSLIVFQGNLYVGTRNDKGAQLWQSSDGINFTKVKIWSTDTDPYGSSANNFAIKSMTVYNNGLYIGTSNSMGSAELWCYCVTN